MKIKSSIENGMIIGHFEKCDLILVLFIHLVETGSIVLAFFCSRKATNNVQTTFQILFQGKSKEISTKPAGD